jgi:hypothetical protein
VGRLPAVARWGDRLLPRGAGGESFGSVLGLSYLVSFCRRSLLDCRAAKKVTLLFICSAFLICVIVSHNRCDQRFLDIIRNLKLNRDLSMGVKMVPNKSKNKALVVLTFLP